MSEPESNPLGAPPGEVDGEASAVLHEGPVNPPVEVGIRPGVAQSDGWMLIEPNLHVIHHFACREDRQRWARATDHPKCRACGANPPDGLWWMAVAAWVNRAHP